VSAPQLLIAAWLLVTVINAALLVCRSRRARSFTIPPPLQARIGLGILVGAIGEAVTLFAGGFWK